MNDTRDLFRNRTERKPASWDSIPSRPVTEDEKTILLNLPVVQSPASVRYPVGVTMPKQEGYYEFILTRGFSNRVYYVNTEGAGYPRYIFEIANMTAEEF